jgi:hypothetical protein
MTTETIYRIEFKDRNELRPSGVWDTQEWILYEEFKGYSEDKIRQVFNGLPRKLWNVVIRTYRLLKIIRTETVEVLE